MNPILVLGLVSSRLHADVAIIKLRRAGIPCRRISAVFLERSSPNTAAWLLPCRCLRQGSQEPVLIAGPLRAHLSKLGAGSSLAHLVEKAGFAHAVATAAEERLSFGEILLCVHARGAREASIARSVLKGSVAERVSVMGDRAEAPMETVAAA